MNLFASLRGNHFLQKLVSPRPFPKKLFDADFVELLSKQNRLFYLRRIAVGYTVRR